jgi:hypothetical protein
MTWEKVFREKTNCFKAVPCCVPGAGRKEGMKRGSEGGIEGSPEALPSGMESFLSNNLALLSSQCFYSTPIPDSTGRVPFGKLSLPCFDSLLSLALFFSFSLSIFLSL